MDPSAGEKKDDCPRMEVFDARYIFGAMGMGVPEERYGDGKNTIGFDEERLDVGTVFNWFWALGGNCGVIKGEG
ncbi:MAG: hypothetical protein ACPGR4_09355 [Paracoccaceae bacterium]